MRKSSIVALALVALAACAGCFREPVSADSTVAPETRVYLKDAGLKVLSEADVFSRGMVFLGDEKGWTNLSARVSALDPTSLDYLNLDYNALTNVDAISAFTSLKWLRLNNNALASLPDLSALKGLRRIYVRDNALASVPETLKDLPALDTVDLSGNPIAEVPDWFASKTGLSHVNLTGTKIVRLPKDLSAWRSLKSLQLGALHLESLEEMKRIRKALPDTDVVF